MATRDGAAEEVAKLANELGSMSVKTSLKAMDAILRTSFKEAGTLAGVINARAISHHILRAADELTRTLTVPDIQAKSRVKIYGDDRKDRSHG